MFLDPKPLRRYPLFVRAFFWKQKWTYGEILKPGMLWARSPLVFATLALLYGALNRRSSPIDGPLRSLVTVRVSQINHCAFCVDINSATLMKRGVSMDKVEQVSRWQSSKIFSEQERVALEYAESMTYSDRRTEAELIDRLRGHFDDDGIAELTGLIAFQNMSSKFNAALDVPAAGFCALPTPVSVSAETAT
jgi:AhpD family alkylhydroperoxidase